MGLLASLCSRPGAARAACRNIMGVGCIVDGAGVYVEIDVCLGYLSQSNCFRSSGVFDCGCCVR